MSILHDLPIRFGVMALGNYWDLHQEEQTGDKS